MKVQAELLKQRNSNLDLSRITLHDLLLCLFAFNDNYSNFYASINLISLSDYLFSLFIYSTLASRFLTSPSSSLALKLSKHVYTQNSRNFHENILL